jgi:adenylate cyclase
MELVRATWARSHCTNVPPSCTVETEEPVVGREIERKFRVRDGGWRDEVARSSRIRQGYLQLDDHAEVRVRVRDDSATLTVKRGGPDLDRQEVEVTIDVDAAERLLAEARVGALLEKTRHQIPIGDLVVEVDEFAGDHEGLVLAEIEVPEATTPIPERPWLSEEVTGDRRFYNATLAR